MATTHRTSPRPARHRAPDGAVAGRVPRQTNSAGSKAGGAPLFEKLAQEWAARGATVPGAPDPLWQRLISYEHLQRDTAATLRTLHLRGAEAGPPPTEIALRRRPA